MAKVKYTEVHATIAEISGDRTMTVRQLYKIMGLVSRYDIRVDFKKVKTMASANDYIAGVLARKKLKEREQPLPFEDLMHAFKVKQPKLAKQIFK